MNNQNPLTPADKLNSLPVYDKSRDVIELINEGRENEAHEKFPMEYHIIKKYDAVNIDELIQLLRRKLEVF